MPRIRVAVPVAPEAEAPHTTDMVISMIQEELEARMEEMAQM